MRGRAYALLLLYNGMFVLPLAAVLALAASGVRSERLARSGRGGLVPVKIALGCTFAGLGAAVLLV